MTLNIGLLGTSAIAPQAIIDPATILPEITVRAVAGRDAAKASAYAARHAIPVAYPSFDDLLGDSMIDVIYVSLPPSHHAYWTIRALEAGKHVICEKPLAMNSAEVRAMLDVAKVKEKQIFEAFHSFHHPAYQTALQWVQSGRIGQVRHITAHFGVGFPDDGVKNQYRPKLGGGTTMDMGCYPLRWARQFAGSELMDADARATVSASGVDDTMQADLTFAGGPTAAISCAMTPDTPFESSLEVTGTVGRLVFQSPLVPHQGGTLEITSDGVTDSAPVSTISTYAYQLRDICSRLMGRAAPALDAVDMQAQQDAIDLLYAKAGLAPLRSSVIALPG